MRQVLAILVSIFAVAGCSRQEAAPAPSAPSASAAAPRSEANRFLAYEHTLYVETDDDKLVALFEAVQAACRAAVQDSCAILEARVSSGESSSASMKFRATATGIRTLVKVLSSQGHVSAQSTTAEDLAGPIADTARQIAMLSDYRDSLEALRRRPTNDLDMLLRLTRELAEVQSQIESLSGNQAQLVRRVETELLNVSINAHRSSSAWEPVAEASSNFGQVIAGGIAGVIMVIAYLVPWVVAAALLFLAAQGFLRWKRRRNSKGA